MTPSEYVANLSAHKTSTYIISPIEGGIKETVIYNGRSYDLPEFNAAYPIHSDRIKAVDDRMNKGQNPDRTKDYLDC